MFNYAGCYFYSSKYRNISCKYSCICTLVLPAVNSCKSKNQVIIMVVNQNYHLLANHNSVAFTANLQLMFIILQPT